MPYQMGHARFTPVGDETVRVTYGQDFSGPEVGIHKISKQRLARELRYKLLNLGPLTLSLTLARTLARRNLNLITFNVA